MGALLLLRHARPVHLLPDRALPVPRQLRLGRIRRLHHPGLSGAADRRLCRRPLSWRAQGRGVRRLAAGDRAPGHGHRGQAGGADAELRRTPVHIPRRGSDGDPQRLPGGRVWLLQSRGRLHGRTAGPRTAGCGSAAAGAGQGQLQRRRAPGPAVRRHHVRRPGFHHHGRRLPEGQHLLPGGATLPTGRSEARSGLHPLLLRHQPGGLLGLGALRRPRPDRRLVGGFRPGRRRHGRRPGGVRAGQALARGPRRAARSRPPRAQGPGRPQAGMADLPAGPGGRGRGLAAGARVPADGGAADHRLDHHPGLSGLVHGHQVRQDPARAPAAGHGAAGRLHRLLRPLRAGRLVAEPVRRAQHRAAPARLLDHHSAAGAVVQRRLHPDRRPDLLGAVGLAGPQGPRPQSADQVRPGPGPAGGGVPGVGLGGAVP